MQHRFEAYFHGQAARETQNQKDTCSDPAAREAAWDYLVKLYDEGLREKYGSIPEVSCVEGGGNRMCRIIFLTHNLLYRKRWMSLPIITKSHSVCSKCNLLSSLF